MQRLFESLTDNIESNIILTAAKLRAWQIKILLNGKAPLAEISKNSLLYRIYEGKFSVNTSIATKISSNKFLTQTLLAQITPYITNASLFDINELSDDTYNKLLQKYHKLVVKPIDQNNGVGVSTGLNNLSALKDAVRRVLDLGCKTVMIEQHIETINEYRLIIWKGEVIDVLQRIPAYVVGDGIHSIRQLIEEKNNARLVDFGTVFEPIVIDDNMSALFDKEKLDLDSILAKSRQLTVKSTCNLSQGGEVRRVELANVHTAYLTLFQDVFKQTRLNYCGADLITRDICEAPVVGQTAINELNGGPGITLAFYADVMAGQLYRGIYQILDMLERDPVQI